jgi:hypothetical protein
METGIFGLSLTVITAALVIYAVVLLLLPFFVFRIRNELIELTRINRQLLALVDAVVPDGKKPKPAPKPREVLVDGQLMRVCPNCSEKNDFQNQKCSGCKTVLFNY